MRTRPLDNPTPDRTALTRATITDLWEAVTAADHRFVDPSRITPVRTAVADAPQAWLNHVLGYDIVSRINLPWPDMVLIADAAVLDQVHLDHLASQALAAAHEAANARRSAQQRAAHQREARWRELRDRIPVPVFVGMNWAYGYTNGYHRGREHIVVQQDLTAGRIRRTARTALCETPSRTRGGTRGVNPLAHLDRGPDQADCETHERIPTCTACLRVAARVATSS